MATLDPYVPYVQQRDASTSGLDLLQEIPRGERQHNSFSLPARSSMLSLSKGQAWLGFGRHTLGIGFLLITVFLFTASNFLASTIFADDSYSKPYFVSYLNISSFSILLLFCGLRRLLIHSQFSRKFSIRRSYTSSPIIREDRAALLKDDDGNASSFPISSSGGQVLATDTSVNSSEIHHAYSKIAEKVFDIRETARLGFEFGVLWFFANYFTTASLSYTSVGSSTILCSTSSIWTLIIGTFSNVEKPTAIKIGGVFASLLGISLTSIVDIFGDPDKNRGSFPHKSNIQIALGDVLALVSAILYGLYTTLMKKRAGSEARIDVLLFFGFVGFFNMVILFPGLFILHYTGIEPFELPPTSRITSIVLINMAISFISDMTWAYAMLLTSPLVVTVGLNLTIPLSLVGQLFINAQNPTLIYWVGAGIVFVAFIMVNHESKKENRHVVSNEPDHVYGQSVGD